MATFTKIQSFTENLVNAGVDLKNDVIQLAFSNTAPATDVVQDASGTTNGILGSVTQINAGAYTNWLDDLTVDRVLTTATIASTHASGVLTYDYTADIIITADTGGISDWRYIYLFDNTIATPVDPLICYWDHGSAITLGSGDSATLQPNASGFFTIT